MNIWDILEIEETKDKGAIQAAYRAKLIKTNPEDDPEGFMELRRALEEALAAADRPDVSGTCAGGENCIDGSSDGAEWGDDPVGLWMKKVDMIYRSFSRRKDPEQWKQLLQEDVCVNLDTKIQVRGRLLRYFMEHYFISTEVMMVLDQHFGFMENMDELTEEFPRDYLDAIIVQGLKRKEYPPYEYLTGDDSCDFDEYLRYGIQLSNCILVGDVEKGFAIVEKMQSMGIEDPFLSIDYAKLLCQAQRFDEAALCMEELIEEYPEIDDVHLMNGDVLFFKEDFQRAAAEYELVLERDSKNQWGLVGKGKCMMETGEYKEANEIFRTILEKNPYDVDAGIWLRKCNSLYTEHLKEAVKDSDDQSLLMELGWCYYQNEEYDQAIALLNHVEPSDDHKIEYESLMGRCCLYGDRSLKAIKHLQNWEALLKALPETEENREKKKRQMPFCVMLQSYAWDKNNDTHKALELTERAMALDPEDSEPVVQKGQILAKMWELEESVEWFSKAIDLKPELHGAYVMRARSLYHMGHYSDAYDDCEKSLQIFPYELAAYVYKVKILLEVGQNDNAGEILNYLEGENLSGSELEFLKGLVKEYTGDKEGAWEIYQDIVNLLDDKEKELFDVNDMSEVYYHLAVMQYNMEGATYGQVEELIEKGLKENPRDVHLMEMKAELEYERGMHSRSLKTYEELAEIAPGRMGIYGAMDNLHRELDQWDQALECAEKQLQQAQSGYAYMRRGQLFAYMNRNKEAESDFKMAMSLAPELSYPYNYMGVLMESYEKEDEALAYYLQAVETGEKENDICNEAYHNAANLYCRKNDFAAAEDILRKGLESTGETAFMYDLILVYRRAGKFDDAIKLLKEYAKQTDMGRFSSKYSVERANIYREMDKKQTAFDMYDVTSVDNSEAGLEAGKILFYKRKYKKALKYIKKAIDLYKAENRNEDDLFLVSEYYLWAARTALEGGNMAEAHSLASEGIAMIPDNYSDFESCVPMVNQMLGGLNTILGNYAEAEEYLQKALESRKCDYCLHGYCIDACYEMIYLRLMQGKRSEALEYLAKGIETDPIDTDFREIKKQIEKGKR